MNFTKIVKLDQSSFNNNEYLKEAAGILMRGGLVIIPTETVYGVAANAFNQKAVALLNKIKNRPANKPFSFIIDDKSRVDDLAIGIPVAGYKLISKFWPGPLTVVLNSSGGGKIGLRMSDNEIALRIASLCGVPLACPSANLSGKPAPVNFSQAIKDLDGLVDFAIDAGPAKLGAESTVVDLTSGQAQVLREGAIKASEIEAVINKKIVLFVCTGNSCRSVMAEALLQKKLKEKGREDVEVLSAGIMHAAGMGATDATKRVLAQDGMDVSTHVSQKITKDMIKKSDLILVMEKIHEDRVMQLAPEAKNRVFLLKEFAKISDDNKMDIADPIGREDDFYANTYLLIKDAVDRIIDLI
ncbi:MAG: threonylcarbamoyl-AMP synthase [Candidatus Omnitrophica bacterium]|nr:threonylcarbamoyl-AMP synthase [Candidatus Omnitrophota bacterium]